MNTEYIKLTDLWNDGQYLEVGRIINNEQLNPTEVAKFCAYFTKYLGTHQLDILHKFL